MSSAVSLEYLSSLINQPSGLAGLDLTGKLSPSVLPAGSIETYRGVFATTAALVAAFPIGSIAVPPKVPIITTIIYANKAIPNIIAKKL